MTLFSNFLIMLIDLSGAQDDPATEYRPTLTKVFEAGIRGIIVRVGFGRVIDFAFRWFWTLAKGVFARKPYWYGDYYSHRGTETTDEQWGERQADVCWNELKYDPGEMKLAWDAEKSTYGGDLTAAIKPSYNRVLRGFKNRWKFLSGKDIEIYASPSLLWFFEDDLKDCDLYLAWWNPNVTQQMIDDLLASVGWRGKVHIIQVSNSGDIDNDGQPEGLELGFESSGLDLDGFLGTEEEYKVYTGGFMRITEPGTESPVPVTPPVKNPESLFQAQCIRPEGVDTRNELGVDIKMDLHFGDFVDVFEVSTDGKMWKIEQGYERWVTSSVNYMAKIEPPVVEPPVVPQPVFTAEDKAFIDKLEAWAEANLKGF